MSTSPDMHRPCLLPNRALSFRQWRPSPPIRAKLPAEVRVRSCLVPNVRPTPHAQETFSQRSGCDNSSVSYGEQGRSSAAVEPEVSTSRRTLQVNFTCNKCDTRSEHLVNPVAWKRGVVFAQCHGCGVWHSLRADKPFIEEIIYKDEVGEPKVS